MHLAKGNINVNDEFNNKNKTDYEEKIIFYPRPAADGSDGRNGTEHVHRDCEGRHRRCRQMDGNTQPRNRRAGQTVTYTGTKKVKSVKAVKK